MSWCAKQPRGRYHRTLRHLIHNWGNQMYKIALCWQAQIQHSSAFTLSPPMPREPSDARAALMAVYLSRRLSFLTPSNLPTAGKKLKSAERPPHRTKHAKELARTNMFMKNLENVPHRRRRDANECTHTIRAGSAGLGSGLGCTGRTIYGVGEASGKPIRRQRRRNIGKLGKPSSPLPTRTSKGSRPSAQLAVIKIGEENAQREAERRDMQAKAETRKRGEHMSGHMKPTGDDTLLGDVGQTGDGLVGEDYADVFFDMYINAEAWGGNY